MLFVAGSTESDRAFLARTERLMEPWRGRVAWADTSSLTYEQTLARILDPGPGTVILVLPFNRDAAGRTLVQRVVAFQVAARAGAPVFTLWDLPVGRGAVGGNVTNFTEVGQQAGEFALGLLGGGRVLTAPVTDRPARSTPLFDWQQIERWHGDPGDLPRASVFVNRPDTLWVHYRREVIWTALFLLTQTVLIAMLLVQLRLRNLAQSRLRESEARFRLLFERAPLGMSIVDSGSGRFLAVNPRMGEIVGYDPAELERTTFQSITHPDHLAADLDSVESLAAGAVPEIGMEKRYLHRSGRVVWVRLRMVRLPCVPGQPLRHMALVEDITEARRAQEALRESETQLMQAQKMESLGVLAAGVAHNINNVLSVIMGTASVRERAAAPGEDREAYRIIGAACLRGRDVVKALVHFAQPALAVHAPFELQALIGEVCGLLAGTARKNIRIVPEPAAAPLWINGDSGSINHVLLNLCINAMDAMPDGGDLRIRTALRDGPWAEVTVEDTGAGMSADVLAHALEPFYTTKEIGKGTGLGLSMSYGVVKAHGGSLDIASQPGLGTTITLQFPRIPAPVLEPRGPAGPPAPLSVFLVDDDEDVRFLMARMLRKAGAAEVRSFAGGQAVLAALAAEALPDLVILDQNMPGLDGAQTLERIRGLHPALPVLISSGQPSVEDWDCFRRPGVAVIPKPFTMGEIQEKLAGFGSLR